MRSLFALTFFLLFFFGGKLFSQIDSLHRPPVKAKKICEINLTDGSSYKGYILKQTDSLIYLKSSGGVLIHIPKHNVAGINFHRGGIASDSSGGSGTVSIAHHYYW